MSVEMIGAEMDPEALTALLAEIATTDDPNDPRAKLVRALFRADEAAAVHDPSGSGLMLRQALTGYGGTWVAGTIQGRLEAGGWGAAMGMKAVRWDGTGDPLAVQAVRSPTLASAWPMLDAFALTDYRRILAPVLTTEGTLLVANLYALR